MFTVYVEPTRILSLDVLHARACPLRCIGEQARNFGRGARVIKKSPATSGACRRGFHR